VSRWDRWPTRVALGNVAGRLPRGKPDEGEPHVRFYVECQIMLTGVVKMLVSGG
jgi:hypothetical protein